MIGRREKNLIPERTNVRDGLNFLSNEPSTRNRYALLAILAEREGVEPSVPLRVHSISNAAQSATLSPLLWFLQPFRLSHLTQHFPARLARENDEWIGGKLHGCFVVRTFVEIFYRIEFFP
jgi:hypothetical protein